MILTQANVSYAIASGRATAREGSSQTLGALTMSHAISFVIRFVVVAGLIGIATAAAAQAQPDWQHLRIGDATDWSFIGVPWRDGDDGMLAPLPAPWNTGVFRWHPAANAYRGQHCTNEDIIQAFYTGEAYADFEAEFKFRWDGDHSGAGIIFRAQDARHYYLAHFPNIGQAVRASHFWAVISKVGDSGWTEVLKMEMLHGVPTEREVWREVRLVVKGNEFRLSVDGRPMSVVTDDTYSKPGFVGLGTWTARIECSTFQNLRIRGRPVRGKSWDAALKPVKNWFLPYPERGKQQSCKGITRAPNGDLLMTLRPTGLVRSTDNGRTWAPAMDVAKWTGGSVHTTPDGRLIKIRRSGKGGLTVDESKDNGTTWSAYAKSVKPAPPFVPPENEPELKLSEPWINNSVMLKDGTLLMFRIGSTPGMRALSERHNIWEWGTAMGAAWSIRSTDSGRTWSTPVPLNGPPAKGQKWDLCECLSTVQTKEGKVLCLVRSIYSPWMWEVWSEDNGKSWGSATPGPFPCWAAAALATKSGVLLVAGRFPGAPGLYVSHDSGMTWKAYSVDTGGSWAMGKMYEVEPGVVLYVYQDTYHSDMRAQFIRITDDGAEPVRTMLPVPDAITLDTPRSVAVMVAADTGIPLEMDVSELWVVNNRSERTTVTLEAGPVDLLGPRPKQVRVEVPGEGWVEAAFTIRPAGKLPDACTVVARWDGGRTEARIPIESVAAPSNPPAGYGRLHAVFQGECLIRGHLGVAEADPAAFGGAAWRARAGQDKAGFIISGPYEKPTQGTYAVAFRVKTAEVDSIEQRSADAPIVEIQAFNGDLKQSGGKTLRASRTLRTKDFAKPGEYQDFWLTFQHAGEGRIEYRALWNGEVDVWINRVVVLSTGLTHSSGGD